MDWDGAGGLKGSVSRRERETKRLALSVSEINNRSDINQKVQDQISLPLGDRDLHGKKKVLGYFLLVLQGLWVVVSVWLEP